MIKQLRNDFLDYMISLKNRSAYRYLSSVADEEAKQKEYLELEVIASKKLLLSKMLLPLQSGKRR